MNKVVVADLQGAELDYWVARAMGYTVDPADGINAVIGLAGELIGFIDDGEFPDWSPSQKDEHGGPIIDAKNIMTVKMPHPQGGRRGDVWCAGVGVYTYLDFYHYDVGDSEASSYAEFRLVAAMRALVTEVFGAEFNSESV